MRKMLYPCLAAFVALTLGGCAHPINMKPEADKMDAKPASVQTIDKKVAYYIPETRMGLETTSPGGGGDLIKYTPYRDIEPGLYKVLTDTFKDVSKSKGPRLSDEQKKDGFTLMMQPDVSTSSSSESIFTWPPTKFTVTLSCNFYDDQNTLVKKIEVTGSGQAEFDEFKKNLSLAANRASTDALNKLQEAVGKSSELRQ